MTRITRTASLALAVAFLATGLLVAPVFADDPTAPITPTPETNVGGVVQWESVAGVFTHYADARAKVAQLERHAIEGYEIEAEGRVGNLRFEVEKEFDTFAGALRAVERLWRNGLPGWVERS